MKFDNFWIYYFFQIWFSAAEYADKLKQIYYTQSLIKYKAFSEKVWQKSICLWQSFPVKWNSWTSFLPFAGSAKTHRNFLGNPE